MAFHTFRLGKELYITVILLIIEIKLPIFLQLVMEFCGAGSITDLVKGNSLILW